MTLQSIRETSACWRTGSSTRPWAAPPSSELRKALEEEGLTTEGLTDSDVAAVLAICVVRDAPELYPHSANRLTVLSGDVPGHARDARVGGLPARSPGGPHPGAGALGAGHFPGGSEGLIRSRARARARAVVSAASRCR
ncbi:MAG: hypothetical protein M5T61_20510 [Acidimicrobiia bacterium]|nr:hypothetical protein [Acidimicrobiia bacterium]